MSLYETIGGVLGAVAAIMTFFWFPAWMIGKTIYDYELSFIPIFAIDLLFAMYVVFIIMPNQTTIESKGDTK